MQCNHGFINHSKTRKTICPDCFKIFCSRCGRKWVNNHLQTNCTPNGNGMNDDGTTNMQMHTNATCPQCKYKYFLERGGCMHITCSQVMSTSALENGNSLFAILFPLSVFVRILRILLQADNGKGKILQFSKLYEGSVVTWTSSSELYVLFTGHGS